jgi:hypothetical protein
MLSPHAPGTGDCIVIEQLLEQLQDSFFNHIILLCRLKDLIAPTDRTGDPMRRATAIVQHGAAVPIRPQFSIYEEAIVAVLTDAGRRFTFQPIYQGVLSRGHQCSKKTVQRYLKRMLKTGRINHDSCGYGLTVASPERAASSQAAP